MVLPSNYASIPADFVCQLNEFDVATFSNEENVKYLQGQVTCDVAKLDDNHAIRGAHCDFKGKSWNTFHLVKQGESIVMLSHKSGLDVSLPELKKYAVFSKVDITRGEEGNIILGGSGIEFEALIAEFFGACPKDNLSYITKENNFVLAIEGAITRYLVSIVNDHGQAWLTKHTQVIAADSWHALDIIDGLPNIQADTSNQFVPQMFNLQCIDGISFDKGCYMGQEMVARTKFLGKNKRAGFVLKGVTKTELKPGDALEMALGENWRKAGTVLQVANLNDESWLFAVLPNDLVKTSILRNKQNENEQFTIHPLPYELA